MLRQYFEEEKYNTIKESDNLIYKALEISTTLFEKDTDKGGNPYIEHLVYVYRNVSTMDEKVVALLHDVIEDKNVTKEDLIEIGFPDRIVNDVVTLTRIKPMEYKEYIDSIIKNGSICALNVKLADILNNMDISRIKNPVISDYERVTKKYIPAHERVVNRLEELSKGGTDE